GGPAARRRGGRRAAGGGVFLERPGRGVPRIRRPAERERGAVAVALVGPPRGGDLPDRGLLQRLHREPWGGRPDDHDERPHLVLLRQAGPADRDRVDRGIRRDVLRGRGGGDRGAGGDRDGRAVPD